MFPLLRINMLLNLASFPLPPPRNEGDKNNRQLGGIDASSNYNSSHSSHETGSL